MRIPRLCTAMFGPSVLEDKTVPSSCILAGIKEAASRALHTGPCCIKRWFLKCCAEAADADHLAEFRTVLASLRFEAITGYVTSIRLSQVSSPQLYDVDPESYECRAESPPLHGSSNILFPIIFGDGTKWQVKL